MPKKQTWIDDERSKKFDKILEEKGLSEHALIKEILNKYIDSYGTNLISRNLFKGRK